MLCARTALARLVDLEPPSPLARASRFPGTSQTKSARCLVTGGGFFDFKGRDGLMRTIKAMSLMITGIKSVKQALEAIEQQRVGSAGAWIKRRGWFAGPNAALNRLADEIAAEALSGSPGRPSDSDPGGRIVDAESGCRGGVSDPGCGSAGRDLSTALECGPPTRLRRRLVEGDLGGGRAGSSPERGIGRGDRPVGRG